MRVIAGEFKGRSLETLQGFATRPTADKVKESLFNIIGPYIEADNVLDLYAGTGGLGIEAVSRGVKHAYMVDSNREATDIIRNNIQTLGAGDRFSIINKPADAAIQQLIQQRVSVNLVFLDPPYAMEVIEGHLEVMLEGGLLSEYSGVVCETSSDTVLPEEIGSLTKVRDLEYGKVRLSIYLNNFSEE